MPSPRPCLVALRAHIVTSVLWIPLWSRASNCRSPKRVLAYACGMHRESMTSSQLVRSMSCLSQSGTAQLLFIKRIPPANAQNNENCEEVTELDFIVVFVNYLELTMLLL